MKKIKPLEIGDRKRIRQCRVIEFKEEENFKIQEVVKGVKYCLEVRKILGKF